ncbi:MAG: hypothetical protein VX083_06585 [Pseudomonadota bacterium]|nr:hypothetical protein [Pseudomonadota bacterium]
MLFNPSRAQLFFVCAHDHRYTVKLPAQHLHRQNVRFKTIPYEALFRASRLTTASYIFSDFDRLSSTELTAAAAVYRKLAAAGAKVINDPALALNRDDTIRRLHQSGLSDFTCFGPRSGEKPERFPVFLRTITGHRGVLSDLLHSEEECEIALKRAISQGYPLHDLVFIEYAAQPHPETGFFQKHSAYFVEDTVVPSNIVNERNWVAKFGEANLATPEQYAQERRQMDDYPHEAWVREVFACLDVGYGRLDFGLVDGRPQAYEVNTNPTLGRSVDHPNPDRAVALQISRDRILEALGTVATRPSGRPVYVGDVLTRKGPLRRLKRL